MRPAIRPAAIDEAQTRRAAAGCIPMAPRTALGLRLVASLWRPGRRLRWYLWGFSGMCHCISRESHCRVCGRAAGAVSGDDAAVSVLRGMGAPSLARRVVRTRALKNGVCSLKCHVCRGFVMFFVVCGLKYHHRRSSSLNTLRQCKARPRAPGHSCWKERRPNGPFLLGCGSSVGARPYPVGAAMSK